MKHECIFCGEVIEPEESIISAGESKTPVDGWTFSCDNMACGAVYESKGKYAPVITVRCRPQGPKELFFEEE